MAAPSKEGLDYFPFDVDLLTDRKLRRVKLKYGYLAPIVYIALLSILYKDKGYYIDYSDNKKDDVIWDILNLLQGKYQPMAEAVAEIIEELVACELFSGDQFNSKIITSIRAQRTYYRSTVDRKAVDIDFDKWLLSESEMKALSEKSVILHNFINRPINRVNRPINGVNYPINPQSKVKESKVNKSKEKKIDCTEPEQAVSMPSAIITLTLNDKTEYPLYQKDIDYWANLYQAVNIMQELRKMKGWCDASPGRRKTKRGIKRFINTWLAKEQDKGGHYGKVDGNHKENTDKSAEYEDSIARAVKRGCTFETSEYDF